MISSDLKQFIKQALQEDVQTGDITSLACIPSENRSKAILKIKEDGILAGVELAKSIFNYLDGSYVHLGEVAFEVETGTRNLLMAERLVLNSMQRMSGIASLCNRFLLEVSDLPVTLLDTRKTTPLNRYLE